MEKEFIPHEQALALKELGFDEPCMYIFDKQRNNLMCPIYGLFENEEPNRFLNAPLYQQAFRWFREKYKLSCFIELIDNSKHYYFDFTICDSKNRDWDDMNCFDSCKRIYDDGKFGTYEEAELECLKKLIEIVKEKK